MTTPSHALSPKEVQQALCISQATFYKLVEDDPDFKTFKVGRHRKMLASDLSAWVEKQKRKEMAA